MNGDPRAPEAPNTLPIFQLLIDGDRIELLPGTEPEPFPAPQLALPPPAPLPPPTSPASGRPHARYLRTAEIICAIVVVGFLAGAALFFAKRGSQTGPQEQTSAAAEHQPTPPQSSDPAKPEAQAVADAASIGPIADDLRVEAVAVARHAVDTSAAALAPFNGYLYDLPRDPVFEAAWDAAVSVLPANGHGSDLWLATLETTAAPNESIATAAGDPYVLAHGCDPHACATRRVYVAFNQQRGTVSAIVHLDNRWQFLGSDATTDRGVLLASVARDRLHMKGRFPLSADAADAVDRFLAGTPTQ